MNLKKVVAVALIVTILISMISIILFINNGTMGQNEGINKDQGKGNNGSLISLIPSKDEIKN